MAKPLFWVLAALLFAAAPAARATELCGQPQPPGRGDQGAKPGDHTHAPRPKWWIDPQLRAELGVTDQQSVAVEAIWQKTAPGLRDMWAKLQKLEDTLTQMTRDDSVAEAAIIAQIEQVENLRADANKRRTIMLYRMNKLLTPDQRTKLSAIRDRDRDRRDGSRRSPPTQ